MRKSFVIDADSVINDRKKPRLYEPTTPPHAERDLTAPPNDLMEEVTKPYIEPPPPGEPEELIILEEPQLTVTTLSIGALEGRVNLERK